MVYLFENDILLMEWSNYILELVNLSQGSKPAEFKWVYRIEYHTDGTLRTYNTRLVVKSFR